MDIKNIPTKKMKYNYNNSITSLENLPNELLLQVLSYLNIVDIYHTFYELNQHFNDLIDASVRHVSLPGDISDTWLDQHTPQISNKITTICLCIQHIEKVFNDLWSFPNLRLINLQGNKWNLTLTVKNDSPSVILKSVLQFLQSIQLYINPNSRDMPSFITGVVDDSLKNVVCPYIERLSINVCYMNDLSIIFNCLPNLTYLIINNLSLNQYSVNNLNTTRLVTLSITTDEKTNYYLLEQLIQSCKTSLQYLKLNVHSHRPTIDGNRLEKLFKSCEKLKKFVFSFEIINKKVDISDCLHSFRSKWWLDTRRPAVYIQQTSDINTTIVTMPSNLLLSFKNNLSNWYFNKGDENSSFVRFNNTNQIHFTNDAHLPITLQHLYSIARIFTSSNQNLYFDYCHLADANNLLEILMDDSDPRMEPVLPNVNHFIIISSNKIESLILSVWILLAPNLRKLTMANLTIFNKIELAKELSDMINDDERLKPRFNEIKELTILSINSDIDTKTKNELIRDFQKVFINAVIS